MNTQLNDKRQEASEKILSLSNKDFEKLTIFLAGLEAGKSIVKTEEAPTKSA